MKLPNIYRKSAFTATIGSRLIPGLRSAVVMSLMSKRLSVIDLDFNIYHEKKELVN